MSRADPIIAIKLTLASAQHTHDERRDSGQSRAWAPTIAGAQEGSEHQGYGMQESPTSQSAYWNTSTSGYNSQQYSAVNSAVNSNPGYASGYHQSHTTPNSSYQSSRSRRTNAASGRRLPRGQGAYIEGDYVAGKTLHYEAIDPSFCVRSRSFFTVGRVFAVMWNETASVTAAPVDYTTSTSINRVKYRDNYVFTNVRRFIVVKTRTEFCFACPIFTYSNRATTKRGVRPEEHAIVYTRGYIPQLLDGENGITKASISVVSAEGTPVLSIASRIYFGIHHPIQYNVRVKDMGHVPQDLIPTLIGNWREEDDKELGQARDVTDNAERPELEPVHEEQPAQGTHNAYHQASYTSQ